MSRFGSCYIHPGFKCRPHFLRLEGERTYNLKNPIVAFEDERGNFSPRRPEPGETLAGPWFHTAEATNEFLLDREVHHIDHARLIENEEKYGISSYFDLVEDSEARRSIQPGLFSFGGFQELKAFPIWLDRDILEYRACALAAVEFRNASRDEFRFTPFRTPSPAETEHGAPALQRMIERVKANRKRRWLQPRKELPDGAPRFYREAQLYLAWYDPDDDGTPVRELAENWE